MAALDGVCLRSELTHWSRGEPLLSFYCTGNTVPVSKGGWVRGWCLSVNLLSVSVPDVGNRTKLTAAHTFQVMPVRWCQVMPVIWCHLHLQVWMGDKETGTLFQRFSHVQINNTVEWKLYLWQLKWLQVNQTTSDLCWACTQLSLSRSGLWLSEYSCSENNCDVHQQNIVIMLSHPQIHVH